MKRDHCRRPKAKKSPQIALTERHLSIPYAVASKYSRLTGHDFDDLLSAANEGLALGACNFKPGTRSKKTGEACDPTTYLFKYVLCFVRKECGIYSQGHNRTRRDGTTVYYQGRASLRREKEVPYEAHHEPAAPEQDPRPFDGDLIASVLESSRKIAPIHCAVLRDHYLAGMSYEAMGRIYGISKEGVRLRINRALKLLRDQLRREGITPDTPLGIASKAYTA